MYPALGRILISQGSSGLSGNSTTALFALQAATSWGSRTFNILEPAYGASGVRRVADLPKLNRLKCANYHLNE